MIYGTYSNHQGLPAIVYSDIPDDFAKLSPLDGAQWASTSPILDWQDAPGASLYYSCIDDKANGVCSGTWHLVGSISQVKLASLSPGVTYEWWIRADNQMGSTYADGGMPSTFRTTPTSGTWVTLTSENFEGSFPQDGWTRLDNSIYDGGVYEIGKRTCAVYNGSYSGWMIGGGAQGSALPCGSNYLDGHDSWFVYGPFSTLGATAAQLDYYFYANTELNYDFLRVLVTDYNDGYYDPADWNGNEYTGSYTWQSGTLDLDLPLCQGGTASCLGRPNMYVAFNFYSDPLMVHVLYGALIDNVQLSVCPFLTCSGSPTPALTTLLPGQTLRDLLFPFGLSLFDKATMRLR